MRRRHLLQIGLFSTVTLAAGGAAALWWRGAEPFDRLGPAGREIFRAVARAVLDGSLPEETNARALALEGLLSRIDGVVQALAPHAQAELAQLLGVLAVAPGRIGLATLRPEWAQASVGQLQEALQSMRTSSLSLRRQAYQALHDITGSAYFADRSTWTLLGYPGPLAI